MEDEVKAPPIGLMPEYIWIEKRIKDILDAVRRYNDANVEWPIGWAEERFLLDVRLKQIKPDSPYII